MTRTHEIKLDGYGAHTTLAEDRPIMLLGTAESYGIETLHVVSGKSWEGLTVTATFNAPDGTSTDMLMDADGSITVPSEATAKSGSGKIVFTGVSNGIQRISCDLDYFVVAHSAINGTQSGGTAPSWFEQAATRFMPAGGTAGQVLTKLTDADFEARWQDSKGGADGKSAYSYAQEGGYTGTEAEFAAKLAAEGLDKALYVVSLMRHSDGTFSADKTFEEIKQAYDEGKYSIVLKNPHGFILPLLWVNESRVCFSSFNRDEHIQIYISNLNDVTQNIWRFATENSKLPNPHPLTFTGAVNATYDGSSAKTIEIPSGGSGAHSDWNQNDSTAADYIKNRPFYTGDPVETVLVEERTVSFVEAEGGLYIAQIQSNFAPTVGETYKVSWDGAVYECTCVNFSGEAIIGNLSLAGAGSDTGEPFLMSVIGNGEVMNIGTLDTSASHTISISGFVSEVVKIDEKYLPDDLTSKISTLLSDVGTLSSEVSIKMDNTSPTGNGSFSLNRKANTTIGANSFAEGYQTTASGENSHAEGYQTTASGENSHAEGGSTTASKNHCHAEGWRTTASGSYSHAEGCQTTASGNESHAEGGDTTASGNNSHAEGKQATASGSYSHAESYQTTASGQCSHAEGYQTTASGKYSHAEGFQTTASSNYQHVQGRYNVEDSSDTYANIVGNGSSNGHSNAYTLDWEGNAWYSGTIEGKALILPSSTAGSTKKFKITVDDSGTISATEVV